jgi:two-component system response regulator MprA
MLVVEDDPAVAAAVRRSMEYSGFTVTVVNDGPAALAHAARHLPDLVILDLGLPGLDGLEVCRALRGLAVEGAAPMVLMLTARDATADRVAGLDAGADDYLVKPFEFEELQARVRALLRRRPAPAGAPSPLGLDDLHVDPVTRQVRRGAREIDLTAQEFDLLCFFARHRGTSCPAISCCRPYGVAVRRPRATSSTSTSAICGPNWRPRVSHASCTPCAVRDMCCEARHHDVDPRTHHVVRHRCRLPRPRGHVRPVRGAAAGKCAPKPRPGVA